MRKHIQERDDISSILRTISIYSTSFRFTQYQHGIFSESRLQKNLLLIVQLRTWDGGKKTDICMLNGLSK